MKKTLIKNARVIQDDFVLPGHTLIMHDGVIADICPDDKVGWESESAEIVVDAQDNYLSPGYIDLHIHGMHRFRVDHDVNNLIQICKILPEQGVTAFLPTLVPKPPEQEIDFLRELSEAETEGAQVLGFHLEGPFVSLTGAIPGDALGKRSREHIEALIDAAQPGITVFSVSPEFENITGFLSIMTAQGQPAFITHTKAGVRETLEAIDAGARHATHFYDVFHVPNETEPGVRPCGAVEAILADPRVSVDFILDGVHVDPIVVKMAMLCKPPDKVCLITDANVGAGLEPGTYVGLGGKEINIAGPGKPARQTKSGALAGSGLTMELAVKNAVEMLGVKPQYAVQMASANPAGVLGLKNKGRLHKGFDADVVMLDEQLNVVNTWIDGVEYC